MLVAYLPCHSESILSSNQPQNCHIHLNGVKLVRLTLIFRAVGTTCQASVLAACWTDLWPALGFHYRLPNARTPCKMELN